MNRNRLIIGLAFAVFIGFLLSAFVYRTFKQMSGVKTAPVQAHIVVASHPMQLGTRLDANSVQLIPWPSGEPIQGMFTRIEDCVGRALITPVAENEPILEAKLASMEAGAGLPATIPEGMRAISVAVNDIVAVAGFVIPGTMVDVLVTANSPGSAAGASDSITQTILENVRVLAAGQQIQQDRDGKPVAVPVITLLVTPGDAAKLAMATSEGKIQLALRNTIDTKLANPAPVMARVLFAGHADPAPRQPGSKAAPVRTPPPFVIEVITGNKRETKTFPNP
jgi:pilus assembly protein CpaB